MLIISNQDVYCAFRKHEGWVCFYCQLPTLQAIVGSESMTSKDLPGRLMSLTSAKASKDKVIASTQILHTDSDSEGDNPTQMPSEVFRASQKYTVGSQILGTSIDTSVGAHDGEIRRVKHMQFLDQTQDYKREPAYEINEIGEESAPSTEQGVNRYGGHSSTIFTSSKTVSKMGDQILSDDLDNEVVDISGSLATSGNTQVFSRNLEGSEALKAQNWMVSGAEGSMGAAHPSVVSWPSRALEWMGSRTLSGDLIEDIRAEGSQIDKKSANPPGIPLAGSDLNTNMDGATSSEVHVQARMISEMKARQILSPSASLKSTAKSQFDGRDQLDIDRPDITKKEEDQAYQSVESVHSTPRDLKGAKASNVLRGEMPRESNSGQRSAAQTPVHPAISKNPGYTESADLGDPSRQLPGSGEGTIRIHSPTSSLKEKGPNPKDLENPQSSVVGHADEKGTGYVKAPHTPEDSPLSQTPEEIEDALEEVDPMSTHGEALLNTLGPGHASEVGTNPRSLEQRSSKAAQGSPVDTPGGTESTVPPPLISLPSGALEWIGEESPTNREGDEYLGTSLANVDAGGPAPQTSNTVQQMASDGEISGMNDGSIRGPDQISDAHGVPGSLGRGDQDTSQLIARTINAPGLPNISRDLSSLSKGDQIEASSLLDPDQELTFCAADEIPADSLKAQDVDAGTSSGKHQVR